MYLEQDLEAILPGHHIDLVVLNAAKPILRYEVVYHGHVVFAEDRKQMALLHIRTYRDYEDYCYWQSFFVRKMREDLGMS